MGSISKLFLVALTISTLGLSHPLEGNYLEPKTGYVFEIDSRGYVITDLAVSAYFRRPYYNHYAAPVTVTTELRKYHPTGPYLANGGISAKGCPWPASFEVKEDSASKALHVTTIHATYYEIWNKGICMKAAFGSATETHIFERK